MKLTWKPTTDTATDLNIVNTQEFVTALTEAGFSLPGPLTDDDLPILRAMAAAALDSRPYRAIIDLIIQHDSIDIWIDE